MLNASKSIAMRNNLAMPVRIKPQPNQNSQFGMTAKNPTDKEKQTATNLKNNGKRVIADKILNVWKIICLCGHQVLGRSGGDLHEIVEQASGHQH
jgi:hypothetical protein